MLVVVFCLMKLFQNVYYYYSLRDEKVKIQNFAEEIMPEQFDDGWQQKLHMKTNMIKILTEELRPFVPKVDGIASEFLLVIIY